MTAGPGQAALTQSGVGMLDTEVLAVNVMGATGSH